MEEQNNIWNKWHNMSQKDKVDAIMTPIHLIIAVITFFTFPWADSLMHPTCVGGWLLCFGVKAIGSLLWPLIWIGYVMTWKI
jgi:hypothetical protein